MLPDGPYQAPNELDQEIFQATVPEDHYLRQVKTIIDFEHFRDHLVSCYSRGFGRPAMEPVLLLKLEFLQFHYNLSDRRVVYQARSDMAMRYFLELSLHSPLPHHTLLTKFRERLGADKHQKLFDAIVAQARQHGLVKDRLRLKDATHVIANIAIPSTIQLVAATRDQLLEAVRPYAAAQVAADQAHANTLGLATADLSDAERLLHRVTHLRAIVSWVDTLVSQLEAPRAGDTQRQSLAEALRLAHKVLADREDPKATDKLVSTQDVDARQGFHDGHFAGYKLDVTTDADSDIITAVNVLPGNGDECVDASSLIIQEQQAHGNKVEAMSIDSVGFRGACLQEWTDPQGLNLEVFVPPKGEVSTPYFMGEHFTLDAGGDRLTCPAGHSTGSRIRSSNDTGWVYRFPVSACRTCPLQQQCMAQLPKRGGRAVFKNDFEKEILAARAKAQTPEFTMVRQQHWRIERKLGEMVRWHRARQARYRGRWKVLLQGLMTAIVVNVKRVVCLVGAPIVRAGLQASG